MSGVGSTSKDGSNKLCSAWDEIHEVFGDGHEYDWALVDDDDAVYDEEKLKPEMKYQDVGHSHFCVCRWLKPP